MDSVPRFVHHLGKDARRRLVEIMLSARRAIELARLLGVAPSTITDFRRGRKHPSDRIVTRMFERAGEGELREMLKVAHEDLAGALADLCRYAEERGVKLCDKQVI
jgi:sugar phosphate isomerase/epimerase